MQLDSSESGAAEAGSPGALERLGRRFKLVHNPVKVAGFELRLPEMADPLPYLDKRLAQTQGEPGDLPYWTKLWPAALVLAGFAARLPASPAGPVLELGAGLGLPGLVAALSGREVVLSDLDPDALEFARAAVELNRLSHLVEVVRLDWTAPPPSLGPFAAIVGAEVLYQPEVYDTLLALLPRLLAPGGRIFLSHQERPFAIDFFRKAKESFRVRRTSQTLHSAEGDTRVFLYALDRPQDGA